MENEKDELPMVTINLFLIGVLFTVPSSIGHVFKTALDTLHPLTTMGWINLITQTALGLIAFIGLVLMALSKKVGVYLFAIPLLISGLVNINMTGDFLYIFSPLIKIFFVFLLLFIPKNGKTGWKILK